MEEFYKFNNPKLLKQALTHSSFANENQSLANNEKLELLGDSVLSLAITDILLEIYPQDNEGEISIKRDKLVNENILYVVAKGLNIQDQIYFGKGEELSGGRNKKRLVASALEAIIGAIYLDSNFDTTKDAIHSLFKDELLNVKTEDERINYKDQLQQFVHKKVLGDLEYRLNKTDGPDHNKQFFMDVLVDGKCVATGQGSNKKIAEQLAAQEAIEKLEDSG